MAGRSGSNTGNTHISEGFGLQNVKTLQNSWKTFKRPKKATRPAECADPPEAQALSLSPCRTAILTRHLWGGRIEDACGEVTGHPIAIATCLDPWCGGCLAALGVGEGRLSRIQGRLWAVVGPKGAFFDVKLGVGGGVGPFVATWRPGEGE